MKRNGNPVADPTTRLLKERIARLYQHLPQAVAGAEEPLHQMRVAARRLRVALPLLARKPEGKRVKRASRLLRDLTRGGGGSRDLDVITALFDERVKATPTPELRRLARDLHAARGRARRRLSGALFDLDIARLRRDLEAIGARRGEPVFTTFGRLRDGAARERADILSALDAVGERFEPAELHGVRIRFRRLRYTAEVMDALRGRESEAPQIFRRVQEAVGRLHDHWVLAAWLEAKAARALAAGRAELAAAAQREREAALVAAREQHREFLALDPRGLLGRGLDAMSARSAA
jgi:CHAD domain-containing protein